MLGGANTLKSWFDGASLLHASPFQSKPAPKGSNEIPVVVDVDDSTIFSSGIGNEYTEVVSDNGTFSFFNLPGIFRPGELVCIDTVGFNSCLGDIDFTTQGPFPGTNGRPDPFAIKSENKPAPYDPSSVRDSFLDYKKLYKVSSGDDTLTNAEEAHLRMHAASLLMKDRAVYQDAATQAENAVTPESSEFLMAGLVADPTSLLLPSTNPFESFFGTPDATVYKQAVEASNHAIVGQLTMNLGAVLQTELLDAKTRIKKALIAEAEYSFYSHSSDINKLDAIDDPAKIKAKITLIRAKIQKGMRLQAVQNAAGNVGTYATIGGKEYNITTRLAAISQITDKAKFEKEMAKVHRELKLVSLANGLDSTIRLTGKLSSAATKVMYGEVKQEDMNPCLAGGLEESAFALCDMRDSGFVGIDNAIEYKKVFGKTQRMAKLARSLLDRGKVDAAGALFAAIGNNKEFGSMITRLQSDLKTTAQTEQQQVLIGTVAITIASMYVGSALGGLAAGAMSARNAPVWAISLARFSTMTTGFVVTETGLNALIQWKNPYDTKAGVWGNTKAAMSKLAWTALMFKFIEAPLAVHGAIVRSILLRRSAGQLIKQGRLAKMDLDPRFMAPKTAKLIAEGAELGTFGKALNWGAKFANEFTAFTAYDFIHQVAHNKLTADFVSKKAFGERFAFLCALKVGSFLSKPFPGAIKEMFANKVGKVRTEASKIMDELTKYESEGKTDKAQLDGIHARLEVSLKARHKIEKRAALLDANFAAEAKQTEGVLAALKARKAEQQALDAIDNGNYSPKSKRNLTSFLEAGKTQGKLEYDVDSQGVIRVVLKGDKPVIKRIVPDHIARQKHADVDTPSQETFHKTPGAYEAKPLFTYTPGEGQPTTARHGKVLLSVTDGQLYVMSADGKTKPVVNGESRSESDWHVMAESDTVMIDGKYYARIEGEMRYVEPAPDGSGVLMVKNAKGEMVPAVGEQSFIIANPGGKAVTKVGRGVDAKRTLDGEQDILTILHDNGLRFTPKALGRVAPNELVISKIPGKTLNNMTAEQRAEIKLHVWVKFQLNIAKMANLGIVHTDIGPHNIMYSQGKLYLIDFGMAKKSIKSDHNIRYARRLQKACEGKEGLNFAMQKAKGSKVTVPKIEFAKPKKAAKEAPAESDLGAAPIMKHQGIEADVVQPRGEVAETATRKRRHQIWFTALLLERQHYTPEAEGTLASFTGRQDSWGENARNFRNKLHWLRSAMKKYERLEAKHKQTGDAELIPRLNELSINIKQRLTWLQRSQFHQMIVDHQNQVATHNTDMQPLMIALSEVQLRRPEGMDRVGPSALTMDYNVRYNQPQNKALGPYLDMGFFNVPLRDMARVNVFVTTPEQALAVRRQIASKTDLTIQHNHDTISRETGELVRKDIKITLPSGKEITVKVYIEPGTSGECGMKGYEPADSVTIVRSENIDGTWIEKKATLELQVDPKGPIRQWRYVYPDGAPGGLVVARIDLQNGRSIGESYTHPNFRGLGLNTRLKNKMAEEVSEITARIHNNKTVRSLEAAYEQVVGQSQSAIQRHLNEAFRKTLLGKTREKSGYTDHHVDRTAVKEKNGQPALNADRKPIVSYEVTSRRPQ